MKKYFTILLCVLAASLGIQAHADLWLIGAISPDGWVTNKGVQFTSTGTDTYTLDLEVTKTGQQYYSLTSKLSTSASDWSGIQASRFGGTKEVKLDTETTLDANTGDSPYTTFAAPGVYTFTFNTATRVLKVSLKQEEQPETFNGTIYIDKASTGNIWAWDAAGNYQTTWPGDAISTLPTATVGGTDYYSFTYSHNSTSPGVIFNDGSSQTTDLTPQAGKVYLYQGGSTVTISDPGTTPTPDPEPQPDTTSFVTGNVYVLGEVNGNTWAPNVGVEMATADQVTYTAKVTTEGKNEGYNYFSFATKLADAADDWDGIAAYRFGAVADGDFLVTDELLGQNISLTKSGYQAFKVAAGEYSLSLNINDMTLVITKEGTTPEPQPQDTKVYVLGEVNGNSWAPNVGVEMTTTDQVTYTAKVTTEGKNEGYNYFGFSTKLADAADDWDGIAASRFGAVADGDFLVTKELLGQNLSLTKENYQSFKVPAGEYTLTVNLTDMTLVIAGEMKGDTIVTPPVEDAKVYVLGEVNGNGWAPNVGAEMNYADGIYTATVTTAGENEGYSYFSFSKKLADAADDWDGIAASRFGAVTDDGSDFLVTDELLGNDLALGADGTSTAFKIGAGTWDLTLNLTGRTLVIKKHQSAGLMGDANDDGEVNASDITAIVSYVLGGENAGTINIALSDTNADNVIDTSDITGVVDIIVKK